ncbi:MAG: hypothetical protein PUH88_00475 [Lachnospiraceae bacterium]|nr:hypothetical protein [Treponema sp.]MDD7112935.1 hypothetical protein [Lachnospiraceae bacterium]
MKKNMKKKVFLFFCLLLLGIVSLPQDISAANVVSKRISEIKKIYPQGSKMNKWVLGSTLVKQKGEVYCTTIKNGGCNALVTYVTMKIFHNPYVPSSTGYINIGTASTTSPSSMNVLFKKAKPGDVVRMYNGNDECHFAIFLSRSNSGIKLYEANFGSKNKVWYNHLWKWNNIKSWSHGATKISVLRSNNYAKVVSGKAAIKYKKGAVFTIDGITYKVKKNSIKGGQIKVISKEANAGKTPKAIGINKGTAEYLRSVADLDYYAEMIADMIEFRTYQKIPSKIQDEQFFTVK